MLNGFAKVLLVATSLAPMAVVYGAARLPGEQGPALQAFAVAALLWLLCVLLLATVRRHGEREALSVTSVTSRDSQVLAFLVAYVLPLVGGEHVTRNPYALVAFALLMGVVLYRANIYHVNPLMGLLGFHFYDVRAASDVPYLLVTRRREALRAGAVHAVRLSPTLWLEV